MFACLGRVAAPTGTSTQANAAVNELVISAATHQSPVVVPVALLDIRSPLTGDAASKLSELECVPMSRRQNPCDIAAASALADLGLKTGDTSTPIPGPKVQPTCSMYDLDMTEKYQQQQGQVKQQQLQQQQMPAEGCHAAVGPATMSSADAVQPRTESIELRISSTTLLLKTSPSATADATGGTCPNPAAGSPLTPFSNLSRELATTCGSLTPPASPKPGGAAGAGSGNSIAASSPAMPGSSRAGSAAGEAGAGSPQSHAHATQRCWSSRLEACLKPEVTGAASSAARGIRLFGVSTKPMSVPLPRVGADAAAAELALVTATAAASTAVAPAAACQGSNLSSKGGRESSESVRSAAGGAMVGKALSIASSALVVSSPFAIMASNGSSQQTANGTSADAALAGHGSPRLSRGTGAGAGDGGGNTGINSPQLKTGSGSGVFSNMLSWLNKSNSCHADLAGLAAAEDAKGARGRLGPRGVTYASGSFRALITHSEFSDLGLDEDEYEAANGKPGIEDRKSIGVGSLRGVRPLQSPRAGEPPVAGAAVSTGFPGGKGLSASLARIRSVFSAHKDAMQSQPAGGTGSSGGAGRGAAMGGSPRCVSLHGGKAYYAKPQIRRPSLCGHNSGGGALVRRSSALTSVMLLSAAGITPQKQQQQQTHLVSASAQDAGVLVSSPLLPSSMVQALQREARVCGRSDGEAAPAWQQPQWAPAGPVLLPTAYDELTPAPSAPTQEMRERVAAVIRAKAAQYANKASSLRKS